MAGVPMTDFAKSYVDAVFQRYDIDPGMSAESFIVAHSFKSRRECDGCPVADICRCYVYMQRDHLCYIADHEKIKPSTYDARRYELEVPVAIAEYVEFLGKQRKLLMEVRINRHISWGTKPKPFVIRKGEPTAKVKFFISKRMFAQMREWGNGSSRVGFSMVIADLAGESLAMPHSQPSTTRIYVYPEFPDQAAGSTSKA